MFRGTPPSSSWNDGRAKRRPSYPGSMPRHFGLARRRGKAAPHFRGVILGLVPRICLWLKGARLGGRAFAPFRPALTAASRSGRWSADPRDKPEDDGVTGLLPRPEVDDQPHLEKFFNPQPLVFPHPDGRPPTPDRLFHPRPRTLPYPPSHRPCGSLVRTRDQGRTTVSGSVARWWRGSAI